MSTGAIIACEQMPHQRTHQTYPKPLFSLRYTLIIPEKKKKKKKITLKTTLKKKNNKKKKK